MHQGRELLPADLLQPALLIHCRKVSWHLHQAIMLIIDTSAGDCCSVLRQSPGLLPTLACKAIAVKSLQSGLNIKGLLSLGDGHAHQAA